MSAWLAALVVFAAPVAHRKVVARDGSALAVYRYRTPGLVSELPPVVMVPELGFSRAEYDFEGRGLARWLASQGREVFVVELAGQGKADPALSLRLGRDLDDVIAALELPSFDLVVHGWAGALVLATHTDDARVRRVVAFSVPFAAEVPSAAAERFLIEGGRFTPFANSPAGAEQFAGLFTGDSDFPTGTTSALLSTGTRDLSRPVATALLTWMRLGDLPLENGSVQSALMRQRAPALLVLPLDDGFAPPEQCAVWRERAAAGVVTLRTFTRLEAGDDFSHLGVLLGSKAPRSVFPEVARFLE